MNTQRLLTISRTLEQEVTKTSSAVGALVAHLEEAINSPDESTQRQVENSCNELLSELSSAPSNRFSPGFRSQLAELSVTRISVSDLVGRGLSARMNEALEGGYTSVKTLDEVRAFARQLEALSQAITEVNRGLTGLGVAGESLVPGQSIIGISIPRERVTGGLRELQREIKFFGQFLAELTEVVDGSPDEHRVCSLYASDFGIDVSATLSVAAQLATIITGLTMAFEKFARFKKLKEDAAGLGVDKEQLDLLTEQGRKGVESVLDKLCVDVFQDCKIENGRLNELKTGVRLRLNGLANRLDQGYRIEVRTELPDNASEGQKDDAKKVSALSVVTFQPVGGPRLLSLPESEKEMMSSPETTTD